MTTDTDRSIGWINCEAIKQVFRNSRATPSARFVLLTIAAHANENRTAWPSIERLVALTGYSRSTIKRALQLLVQLGELEVHPASAPNGKHLYRLPPASPDDLPARRPSLAPRQRPAAPSDVAVGNTKAATSSVAAKSHQRATQSRLTPRGVQPARRGFTMNPKQNKEQSTEQEPSPLPPPTPASKPNDNGGDAGGQSNIQRRKATTIRQTLGDELFGLLQTVIGGDLRPRRFDFWLVTRLGPHIERLGSSTFRAALEQLLPEMADPSVRFPDRLLLKKLSEIPAPAAQGGSVQPQGLRDEIRRLIVADDGGEGPLKEDDAPSVAKAAWNIAKCPYGDHAKGDACCLPAALKTLAWAVPFVDRALRQGRRDEEVRDAASLVDRALTLVEGERERLSGALGVLDEGLRESAATALRHLDLGVDVANEDSTAVRGDWPRTA